MARSTFKFRLQRLLDVRVMREKQAQQELQARRQRVVEEERRLVEMKEHEVQLRDDQKRPLERGEDLERFAMRRHFLEQAIVESIKDQGKQQTAIEDAQQRVVEQQEVVKQRGIDVKALEKLKEKQREEHRLDQLREEGLFLDDLAGQGFLRRRTISAMVEQEEQAARDVAAQEENAS